MTALSWDSTIQNDGGDFKLLEPGVHPFIVKGMEKGYYNGGRSIPACPQAKLTLRVGEGADTSDVVTTLLLDDSLEWKLCQFFLALGLRKHGEPLNLGAFDRVIGCRGYCETGHREYKNKDGEDKTTNEVVKFLDPADVVPAQPMQAQPMPQQPAMQPAQTAAAGW